MRIVIVSFVVLLLCVYGVWSTSPMNCAGCDPMDCNSPVCLCGSYKDECNCCDRCFVCPGEECNYFANDRCLGDAQCSTPDGLSIMETMMQGKNGKCSEPSDEDDSSEEVYIEK